VSTALVSLAVILLLSSMAMRARRQPNVAGGDTLIGMTGELLELDPTDPDDPAAGWAQVRGERWRVHCDGPVARGDRIRVTARHGLTLDVVPASS
jgi:membrane-bound serine protease (ClpP class)